MRLLALALVATAAPLATAATPLLTEHLVLNEVMPDPTGSDFEREWVEIYNPTARPVPLDGWMLTDHDAKHDELDGLVAPALGLLLVTLTDLRLSNLGDDVVLRDPTFAIVDRVVYGYGAPSHGWPRHPVPGEGASLARWHVLAPDGLAEGGNDEWHVEGAPTPGRANRAHVAG